MKLGLVIAALLCAALPRSAALDERERVWMEVVRPYNGWIELGLNSLIEVRGSAGSLSRGMLDIVVIIDVSRSTRSGSGVDVNGDGYVGGIGWSHRRDLRSFLRHPQTSSDPEDAILHAETEAVRQMLQRLDLSRTRIGIVELRESAQLRSSIGNRKELLLGTLDTLDREIPHGRTNIAESIRIAAQALHEAGDRRDPDRELTVILLSDGKPTVPAPDDRAAAEAVRAAQAAYRQGIRIHTLALGVSEKDARSLAEIAEVSKGAFTALAGPGEIIHALPRLDLRGLAHVSVENRTTGKRARALRVWADGSFDGFVELRPGKNKLVITARGPEGARLSEERFVYYEKQPPRTPRERRLENEKLLRLRDFLRDRSIEVEIAREGERRRDAAGNRSLTIEPED